MARADNLPGFPFRFWNRLGDMEFVVSRAGSLYAVAEPTSDDEGSDEDDEDEDVNMGSWDREYREFRKRREFARVRRRALKAHGYMYRPCDRIWTFKDNIHSSTSLWDTTEDMTASRTDWHDNGWKSMAVAVVKAYNTRVCACARRLCAFGSECFMCALETAGGPVPVKPPEFIGEMALSIMKAGGDWKCESEGAGSCAVCYKRKTRQLMFTACGHLACGECCARLVKAKACPHCRVTVTALHSILYSA
jgi:hypothetical protein